MRACRRGRLARTVELAYSHDTKHTHTNRSHIVTPGPGFDLSRRGAAAQRSQVSFVTESRAMRQLGGFPSASADASSAPRRRRVFAASGVGGWGWEFLEIARSSRGYESGSAHKRQALLLVLSNWAPLWFTDLFARPRNNTGGDIARYYNPGTNTFQVLQTRVRVASMSVILVSGHSAGRGVQRLWGDVGVGGSPFALFPLMQLFTLLGANLCNTRASEPAAVALLLGYHLSLLPAPLTGTDSV